MDYNNISILYKTNKIDKINSSFSINTEKLIFTCLHLYVYAWLCVWGRKNEKETDEVKRDKERDEKWVWSGGWEREDLCLVSTNGI